MLRQLLSRHRQASSAGGLACRGAFACWQTSSTLAAQPTRLSLREGFSHTGRDWPQPLSRAGVLNQQGRQLSAEPQPQTYTYTIEVVTGDVRGAGTKSPALVKLVGTRGASEELFIGNDGDDWGFERGTTRSYQFEVDSDLGELKRVFVRQVGAKAEEADHGWYLEEVTVSSEGLEKLTFPGNCWLGKSNAGDFDGFSERNLIPCKNTHSMAVAQEQLNAQPLEVAAGAVAWPHPEKVAPGLPKAVNRKHGGHAGEDAYFCLPGRTGIYGLGVADGVYMWRHQGIDAGELARMLMSSAAETVGGGSTDVLHVLQTANSQTLQRGCKGSSTCCILIMDLLQGRLQSANIGDSGYVVLGTTPQQRGFHVKFHTPQQEHSFGCPYQLGHGDNADHPDSAMLASLPITPGDVVVAGSDGLWDNLSQDDIVSRIHGGLKKGTKPPMMAVGLATAAFEASRDRTAVTPYSEGASDAFDMVYEGGKKDDITVVVAHITPRPH